MPEEEAQEHVKGTSPPHTATTTTTITTTTEASNDTARHRRTGTDPDAQDMVISSLKSQIQDLFSQVNELNNKLVKSYDRVSDLEDDIHVASANLRSSSLRISQLELERTQHLAALNTGLLVEKAHVTAELNRLMEKATEEAAQRGQAESARQDIEKDLDDLSASLFGQANTMVAEARFAQHLSERKVDDAERALKGAEEMVGLMQTQMQAMQAAKEESERKMREMQVAMGKGKWNERLQQQNVDLSRPLKLLSSHVPYQEFLMFVAHIRSLHQTSPSSPAMATLLPLPFLSRLSTEDAEPTVRLDLAPALNWLSRRSVLAAIHNGQLTIEPIPVSALFSETTLYSNGINPNNDSVSCALCGTTIVSASEHAQHRRPMSISNSSWSGSFFKRTSLSNTSVPPSPTSSVTAHQISRNSSSSQNGPPQPQQVFIFRVASLPSTGSSISSALPISALAKSLSQGTPSSMSSSGTSPSGHGTSAASSSPNNQPMTIYPLCSSGWCLMRLRTTCTLWSFVRTSIVEKVWEEEIPWVPPPPSTIAVPINNAEKPPVPPPRKRGLWGIASAIGERAASWTDSGEKKGTSATVTPSASPPRVSPESTSSPQQQQQLPPPLPPRREVPPRRLPPPLPPVPASDASSAAAPTPPPLPKRSEVRKRASMALLSAEGESGKDGVNEGTAGTGSNPTTPTRVVFDAGASPSPSRVKKTVSLVEERKEDDEDAKEESQEVESEEEKDPSTPIRGANIPLPDSPSPNSAGNTTGISSLLEKNTSPPPLPARIASPIKAAAGVTGTPPPLPRRAAARRPISAMDGASGSRPATPTPLKQEAKVQEEEEKQVATEGAVERENVEDDAQKEEGAEEEESKAGANENVDEDKVDGDKDNSPADVEADRSKQTSPSSDDEDDVFVDAPATTKAQIPDIITTTTSSPDLLSPDKRQPTDDTITDNDNEEKEGDSDDSAKGTFIRSPSPPSPSYLQFATGAEDDGADETDAGDPNWREVYIGDATWEERTWKELVKLKEDMFWSRIGGWR